MERKIRDKIAWRALTFWDDDQRLAVERSAARLARDPARIVGELRITPQGCDWLIQRWGMLAAIADRQVWNEAQQKIAYNLLGTPPDLRMGSIGDVDRREWKRHRNVPNRGRGRPRHDRRSSDPARADARRRRDR